MGAYSRGALIKKIKIKGGCLFEIGANSRVGANLSTYGNHYGGKNCMKKFCKDLRERTAKIINYEKKKNDTINNRRKNTL